MVRNVRLMISMAMREWIRRWVAVDSKAAALAIFSVMCSVIFSVEAAADAGRDRSVDLTFGIPLRCR
jgi:hypothetical protein